VVDTPRVIAMPILIDHLFVLAVVLIAPAHARRESVRLQRALEGRGGGARMRAYARIIAWQWGSAAVLLAAWFALRRTPGALGVSAPAGRGVLIAAAIALAIIAVMAAQVRAVRRRAELAAQARAAAATLAWLLPASPAELRRFFALGCTAGTVEELIYRGYLMWYVGAWAPTWVAIVATSAAFGAAHLYQGPANALKTALVGLVMGCLFWLSGSLWVPMALHAATDVLQGWMIYIAMRAGAGEAATIASPTGPRDDTPSVA